MVSECNLIASQEKIMRTFLKIHLLFFIIALIIAFILFPIEMLFFEGASNEDIQRYYQDAITLEKLNAWKICITWFIGLTCGRLILRALRDPSLIDPKHKR